MADSFERLSNAYHKAYTVYHREIDSCPHEEWDEVWDIEADGRIAKEVRMMREDRRVSKVICRKCRGVSRLWIIDIDDKHGGGIFAMCGDCLGKCITGGALANVVSIKEFPKKQGR